MEHHLSILKKTRESRDRIGSFSEKVRVRADPIGTHQLKSLSKILESQYIFQYNIHN